jgi:sulfoacetaldehyde acetyltransferase
LPGYGIDYWPKTAKIIQVDINADRIGLTKPVTVGICGDAKLVAQGILAQLSPSAGNAGREDRKALIHTTRSKWLQTCPAWIMKTMTQARPGMRMRASAMQTGCRRVRPGGPSRLDCPRMRSSRATSATTAPSATLIRHSIKVRKYLAPGLFGPCGYGFPSIIGAKIGNPDTPCIGFAGDGAFGISMNEMSSIGREEWPGVTMVVFRNYQWGAEKRNSILWFDDNFVGTELDPHLSYAKVAEACGLKGVVVKTPTELTGGTSAVVRSAEEARHDLHRGGSQSGAWRTVPPRCHEETGGRSRHQTRGHASTTSGQPLNAELMR